MTRNQLDPAAIDVFAGFRHGEWTTHRPGPGLADPQAVGDLAHRMALALYQGVSTVDDGAPPRPLVARCAGLLVYAMEGYGLDYEAVCDIADHSVAQVVARITPDNRIPAPRRHLAQRSAIGQCDDFEQLVKLAEITCAARDMQSALAAGATIVGSPKDWADKQLHLVGAMGTLAARGRVQGFINEARRLLGEIARMPDGARKTGELTDGQGSEVEGRRDARVRARGQQGSMRDPHPVHHKRASRARVG